MVTLTVSAPSADVLAEVVAMFRGAEVTPAAVPHEPEPEHVESKGAPGRRLHSVREAS